MKQEWRPLRRGVNNVSCVQVEVFPVVVDYSDFVWVNIRIVVGIRRDGVGCPAAFPQSVRREGKYPALNDIAWKTLSLV